MLFVVGHEPVTVHEIEIRTVRNAPIEVIAPLVHDLVPADVRNPEFAAERIEAAHLPRNQAETPGHPALVARGREHLHAQTDAEQGFFVVEHRGAQRIHPAAGGQRAHSIAERAHSRQHDAIRAVQHLRPIGDIDLAAQVFERPSDRGEVSHSIVDYRNPHGLS